MGKEKNSDLTLIEQVNNTSLKDELIRGYYNSFPGYGIKITFAYIGDGKAALRFFRRDTGGDIKRSFILTDDDCVLSSGKCSDDYRAEFEFPYNYIKESYFSFMSQYFTEFKPKEMNDSLNIAKALRCDEEDVLNK